MKYFDNVSRMVLLSACIALGGMAGARAQEQSVTLRVGGYYPVSHEIAQVGILPYMEAVEERSAGRISFDYFPGEQAGKARDLPKLIASGVVDMGLVVPGYVPAMMPLGDVIALPGLYSDSCTAARTYAALEQPDAAIGKEEMTPHGLRVLFTLATPPFELWFTKKVTSLEDIKGMKIRVATAAQDMFTRLLGGVPIRMTGSEVYNAFSRGTVDGGIFAVATVVSWNLGEIVKSGTRDASVSGFAPMYAVNAEKWATIPPDLQAILIEEGEKIMESGCKALAAGAVELNDDLAELGVEFLELSPHDRKTIQGLYETVADDWVAQREKLGKPARAVLEAWREQAKSAN